MEASQAIRDAVERRELEKRLKELGTANDMAAAEEHGVERGFLRRHGNTEALRRLEGWAGAYQAKLRDMAKIGKPIAEIREAMEGYTEELKAKYREEVKAEHRRLGEKFQDVERDWKADHRLGLEDMLALQAKYGGMDKEALRKRVHEYMATQDPEKLQNWQPYELDLLAQGLTRYNDRESDLALADLRSAMELNLYTQPWIYSEAGQEVLHEGKLYVLQDGEFALYIDDAPEPVPFNIDGLLQVPKNLRPEMRRTPG